MKASEAGRLVGAVLVAYPTVRLTEQQQTTMVELYISTLADLTYEHCNVALLTLIKTAKFMPTVAEIRGAALELAHGPVRAGGEAWGDVVQALRRYGLQRSPGVDFTFADPVVARCVKALTWGELCRSENVIADRARFVELYDRLASEVRREQQAPELAAARQRREVAGPQAVGALANAALKRLGGGE